MKIEFYCVIHDEEKDKYYWGAPKLSCKEAFQHVLEKLPPALWQEALTEYERMKDEHQQAT